MTLQITYIGHATALIEWNGIRILTDPVFSERILCFKRIRPMKYDIRQLPKLDAILLSHAHYDHLDLFSYKYISSEVPILVPEGMSNAISHFVNNPIIELSTWARYNLKEGCEICAVPAKHPGGRFLFPFRYYKCHGYVVTLGGESLYFAGDTAYGEEFKKLRQSFNIKTALLPLAKTMPGVLCPNRHMSVDDAIQAWEDLGEPNFIPIHWGTFFKLFGDTTKNLKTLQARSKLKPSLQSKLHILDFAESITL